MYNTWSVEDIDKVGLLFRVGENEGNGRGFDTHASFLLRYQRISVAQLGREGGGREGGGREEGGGRGEGGREGGRGGGEIIMEKQDTQQHTMSHSLAALQ